MDPVPNVLDEKFFTEASPECLQALALLMDDAIALRLQAFIDSVPEDNKAAVIIKEYLGDSMKAATFHLVLRDRGSCQIVAKLSLETLAGTSYDTAAVVEELEFIKENFRYVKAFLEPRKITDYSRFVDTMPPSYRKAVNANKVIFYQAHARTRATGAGVIINKKDVWTIALKGLKFRSYCVSAGMMLDGYAMKEY